MPTVGFIDGRDPLWLSTLDAMDDELVTDSLVYRYDPEASPDGLRGSEGTFSLCTFSYVDALARAGRLDEARIAFEKMLTYANHVGLYSEEIALTGEQIGNFPQAFTHLSLIDAAVTLDAALDGRRRADADGRRTPRPQRVRTDGAPADDAGRRPDPPDPGGTMTQTAPDNALGRIAAGDAPVLETLLEMNLDAAERSGLDAETYLLVRLAALVAMDAAPVSYLITLGAAADAGLTVEKAQAVLVAIAPVVGSARVTAAAGAIIRGVLGAAALAEPVDPGAAQPVSRPPAPGADPEPEDMP